MPNEFFSPEGDLEKYYATEYWLIDQYIGDSLWTWGTQAGLGHNGQFSSLTPVTTFAGGITWKQISCGYNFTAAIKTDGTLWTWGYNSNGQLGINTTVRRTTPVTTFAGGTNWKQVSGGYRHTAAIKTDGTLWTWGYNGNGQLGINDNITRSTPVTTFAGGTDWKQVSCGSNHISAIKTDGTLWTWGYNNFGQLGRKVFPLTPVTTFAGGNNWSDTATGASEELYTICAGYSHTGAIKTDGTLWTWGYNSNGQLGINTFTTRSTPVTTFAGGITWKQISCGYNFTAAIKTDGTLWTWGSNVNGQLGDNTNILKSTPVTTFAGGTNWKQVSCSGGNSVERIFTLAIKTDGTLWTWGSNLADFSTKLTPVTTFAGGTT